MPRKRKPAAPLDANLLRPQPLDLFGEVIITQREVMLWMWKVPFWMTRNASAARIADYIRGWDVPGKIRRAKTTGRLEEIFGDEACPHCGVRLEMDYERRIETMEAELLHLRPALQARKAEAIKIAIGMRQPKAEPRGMAGNQGIEQPRHVTLANMPGDQGRRTFGSAPIKRQNPDVAEKTIQRGAIDLAEFRQRQRDSLLKLSQGNCRERDPFPLVPRQPLDDRTVA